MHILFVDDTFETRDLFRLCFTMAGHTADTAHNGMEALQIIQQNAEILDIIIMDYHMPQMNGLEVVRQLRDFDDVPAIPIVLFTSDRTRALLDEAEELKVTRVIHKPIVPNELIAMVQEIVGESGEKV